ncbi:MAG: hypothetical protein GX117_12040 [Candidatus Hydrogenedentes bacterium]|nr:hypothetical protein [Candidatus Hydrogenedentota bacterium]
MQKISIGADCVFGLGAVVLKDVPSGAVMVGNPAKLPRLLKQWAKMPRP